MQYSNVKPNSLYAVDNKIMFCHVLSVSRWLLYCLKSNVLHDAVGVI